MGDSPGESEAEAVVSESLEEEEEDEDEDDTYEVEKCMQKRCHRGATQYLVRCESSTATLHSFSPGVVRGPVQKAKGRVGKGAAVQTRVHGCSCLASCCRNTEWRGAGADCTRCRLPGARREGVRQR
jgi:hypothetical protein